MASVSVRGVDVFVVQPACPRLTKIVELLVMIDAFRRALASRINAMYLTMDMVVRIARRARDPITAKLVSI